jgi:hypothetical protein
MIITILSWLALIGLAAIGLSFILPIIMMLVLFLVAGIQFVWKWMGDQFK